MAEATFLVGVSGNPLSARLVQAAARLAAGQKAGWIAVHVETPSSVQQTPEAKDRLFRTLKLAEHLGGETLTLTGHSVAREILLLARARGGAAIVLGKPSRSRWRDWIFGSVIQQIAHEAGEIDVYILSGEGPGLPARTPLPEAAVSLPWRQIGAAAAVVAGTTLAHWPLSHVLNPINLAMIYLVGIMWAAYRWGRWPAMAASLLSVLAFDFFFVPPLGSLRVADTEYWITFAVMLIVGLSISTLAGRLSRQTDALQGRERRARLLYEFSRMLSETPDPKEMVQKTWQRLSDFYKLPILMFLPQENKEMAVAAGDSAAFGLTRDSMAAVDWVMMRDEAAGIGTDTLASLGALFLPLKGLQQPVGVLAIKPTDDAFFHDPDQYPLLETLASEFGGALESTQLTESAGRAQAEIETQRLRNLLLTSLSYDLRDPLRRLSRRVHELLDGSVPLSDKSRQALMKEIQEESERLEKMAADLLQVIDAEVSVPKKPD